MWNDLCVWEKEDAGWGWGEEGLKVRGRGHGAWGGVMVGVSGGCCWGEYLYNYVKDDVVKQCEAV
jgi:hypothetical protein